MKKKLEAVKKGGYVWNEEERSIWVIVNRGSIQMQVGEEGYRTYNYSEGESQKGLCTKIIQIQRGIAENDRKSGNGARPGYHCLV